MCRQDSRDELALMMKLLPSLAIVVQDALHSGSLSGFGLHVPAAMVILKKEVEAV